MGKYINTIDDVVLPATGKAKVLIANGAKEIQTPRDFVQGIICVVDNGFFEAAGYAFSKEELEAFQQPGDHRRKQWLLWDKAEQYAV